MSNTSVGAGLQELSIGSHIERKTRPYKPKLIPKRIHMKYTINGQALPLENVQLLGMARKNGEGVFSIVDIQQIL